MADIFPLVDNLKFVQDIGQDIPGPTAEDVVQVHLKGLLVVLLNSPDRKIDIN